MEEEKRVKKPFYKRWWFIAILVFVIAAAILGSGEDEGENQEKDEIVDVDESEENLPAEEEAEIEDEKVKEESEEAEIEDEKVEEETEITKYKSGNYKVGEDIPAGEYKISTDTMGYVEVSKDSSGEFDSIITNDNFSTFIYLTVEDGQYLKLQLSEAVLAEDAPPYDAEEGYGPGEYKVGYDIPAGEYNIQAEEDAPMAYVEVSKDSKGGLDSIITNDNFEGNKYITVKDGQYLKLQMAYIEK